MHERGDAFEVFAEDYLATQKLVGAEEVWPADQVPIALQSRRWGEGTSYVRAFRKPPTNSQTRAKKRAESTPVRLVGHAGNLIEIPGQPHRNH